MAQRLIILLHGAGADAQSMREACARLDRAGRDLVALDGFDAFERGTGGRQWFSLNGITPQNRAERVRQVRPAFDALLTQTIADHGFTGREDDVALLGFSQGAILILDAVARGRWRVGAAVACAGRLNTDPPYIPTKTPVLLVHGSHDPVIASIESLKAAECLTLAGGSARAVELPGLAHHLDPAMIEMADDFLGQGL